MKNLSILLFLSLSILSCKKDDESIPPNQITIGEDVFQSVSGLIVDNGALDTHYNYTIYVSDGHFGVDEGSGEITLDETAEFYIYADLVSPGDDQFIPGTFVYNSAPVLIEKSTFLTPIIYRKVGNTFFPTFGNGGTITVSGTAPNLTVSYDLILNDQLLFGSYTGTFVVVDN